MATPPTFGLTHCCLVEDSFDTFGDRTIYDLGLGRNVKVSKFLNSGNWEFPHAPTHGIRDIFQVVLNSSFPFVQFEDEAIYTGTDHGSFTLASALFPREHQLASWRDLIWFRGRISRHSSVAWMPSQMALKLNLSLLTETFSLIWNALYAMKGLKIASTSLLPAITIAAFGQTLLHGCPPMGRCLPPCKGSPP